jgi:predicted nucleic-acid-binding Zn-ribbon protein
MDEHEAHPERFVRYVVQPKKTMNTNDIEHLPAGTTTCPRKKCKSQPFEWEQIHGMRMIRSVEGSEVYHVRCAKCGSHYTVLK